MLKSGCGSGCDGGAGVGGCSAGGGGGLNDHKQEELQPHSVKEQLPGVQYSVNSHPPWPEAIILGSQHFLLTFGMTLFIPSMIVPLMGGHNVEKAGVIQSLLFVSGLNTLFQSLFGTRLPTVISASYTFVAPTISIVIASRYRKYLNPQERFVHTMRGIQGSLITASVFQTVIGFMGFWRIAVRFLTPVSLVPLVTLLGFGLFHLGFPLLGRCVEIGLPELILMLFISQYLPHKIKSQRAKCDRFALLFSVAIVWMYSQILTLSGIYNDKPTNIQISCRTDHSGLLSATPWIMIPTPFRWGPPTFNAGEGFTMMAASFVALVESTGTNFAAARYAGVTPVPPSIISRGAGWLGLGVLLNGIFGTVTGAAASVENVGLLALTRVGSRRVIQISAGFMLFFSVFGKFGALFASIPMPIFAAVYCILFAYASSAGLGLLQFCNLNSFRTKFILGFSLFTGLSVPEYVTEYLPVPQPGFIPIHSSWFNGVVIGVFTSRATVAALIALFLDCTLCRGNDPTRRDSGSHWWEKFTVFKGDVRSEEFYSLPFKLDRLFPSL